MGENSFITEDDNFNWDSEDEQEINNVIPISSTITLSGRESTFMSCESNLVGSAGSKLIDHFIGMGFSHEMVSGVINERGEENMDLILEGLLNYSARPSAGSSKSKLIDHFVGMGFCEEMVVKLVQDNVPGQENMDAILESLLAYSAIENCPKKQLHIESDSCSSEYDGSLLDDFSDTGSSEDEICQKISKPESEKRNTLLFLTRMGYLVEDASIAIERCGLYATISELTDFICAAQMARAADSLLPIEKPMIKQLDKNDHKHKRRGSIEFDTVRSKKQVKPEKKLPIEEEEMIRLPKPMIGYGVPTEQPTVTQRTLPEAAIGPPFFYFENVALAPRGVWDTISRFLYDVEPEFVDSRYFCAAARKRGYVHNLPIQNRFPLLPLPPHTIQEALPLTRKWWPSWDMRTKLNCLQTCVGSAKLTERIRKALEDFGGEPPMNVQKFVLYECRKWNLVWVGRNKVAPLEPDEVEMLLGFPKNHTRGGGISRTDRYKSLGNSFQVDTVAYHLSVLKELFPGGINLLSLFTGIGGAEVALNRVGVRLKNVVSIEISEANRNILRSWWEQTNQTGNLVDIADVQQMTADRLQHLMISFGGFDLVVGGSPCNNLTGSNRHHRDGLDGQESSLFYDYCRILDLARSFIIRNKSC